jgi:NAD-dependent SIR2 family protein deacetylase
MADGPDYVEIVRRLKAGTIVPFFGAGASIASGLPSASKLAERLVAAGKFPDADGRDNLALVASYLVQSADSLALRDQLREALNVPAKPGRLHQFLARDAFSDLRLFVTTNYDDLIEQSLESRQPWVVVDRGTPGTVWYKPFAGAWDECESKNLGYKITDNRPIVLKLHGSLDRVDRDNDSFLITEEHYVNFLGRSEGGQVPQKLATAMRNKSFLFLGYGLRDWNVRVLLHKLALARGGTERIRSWAIVLKPSAAETELWKAQNVEMHGVDLDEFVQGLEAVP